MTHGNDSPVGRHRVDAFASEDELTIQEFLQAAPTAPARPTERRRPGSSLYQRIGHAGGLLWLVNALYLRVLADPLLMSYFKHLDGQDRQWLRWHMLTLLAVVTGGPSKYEGRDLHAAHADLHITEEAFDQVVWHLQATLQELEVQQEDRQAILAAVQAPRDAVVTFEKSSEAALLPRDRVDI
jgi:hemoglobin